MSLIKGYLILQNASVTDFSFSELLRESNVVGGRGGGVKFTLPPLTHTHTHTHTHTDTQSYSYYIKVKKNLPSCDHTFQKSYISLAFFRSITLLFFRLSIMFTFFKSNKARIFKGSCFWGMSISCLINLSRRTNPILM